LQFSYQDFPEGIPLFPKHDVVLAYLEKYAKNVRHLIHFSTQVVDISLQISSQGKDMWQVKTLNLLSQLEMVENFDAVVVASGRAALPYIPDIPGIADWNSAYPGSIIHSKSYRLSGLF
jgi:cation diffusion facilitator CzcD-associated flavoprotein CzcO